MAPAASTCDSLVFTRKVSPWDVEVRARDGAKQIGELRARTWREGRNKPARLAVNAISVFKTYQRCGVATRMYELAAREACARGELLASDLVRTPEAQAFWQKQVDKGRAQCAGKVEPEDDVGRGGCSYYVLNECPSGSLAGHHHIPRFVAILLIISAIVPVTPILAAWLAYRRRHTTPSPMP